MTKMKKITIEIEVNENIRQEYLTMMIHSCLEKKLYVGEFGGITVK